MLKRLFIALMSVVLFTVALVACDSPQSPGSPSANCPSGWMRVSQQAWVQADKNGDGRVDFPQTLPNGGGGHLHEEFCFPVGGQLAGGRVNLSVDLMSHQGFQGHGDKVDIGLAPGGDSHGRSNAPDMACGPKPQMCHNHVNVSASGIPGGEHSLRVRYLPAELPSGERWFVGGEMPLGGAADGLGGKSWLDGYANARFSNLSLFNRTLSGTVQVPVYTKGDHINWALVHVDARFGADSEGRLIAARQGEFRGNVSLDTRQLTNGWHCLAVRADAGGVGNGRVHTGVIEAPIFVHNEGRPNGNGTGGCFPSVS